MTFKQLSKKDQNFIGQVHADSSIPWQSRMNMLTKRFDTTERTIRKWIRELGFSKPMGEDLSDQLVTARSRMVSGSKFYIISCCQNATPVHPDLLHNMEAYAKEIGAEIHIVPFRYRNPTSVFTDRDDDWWVDEVTPYLSASRLFFNNGIVLLGDVKVQPTASNPLNGFEGLTGDSTTIIGHPRVHIKSCPVLDGHDSKMMLTTGAVSLPNYTDSMVGKKGEFHHTYGFVIVEIKNKNDYFVRQVTAENDGSFCDLLKEVKNGKVTNIDSVEAYVMGDLHSACKDEPLYKATLDILQVLKPKNVILHDVFNGNSITHHERNDPIKSFQKMSEGKNLLIKDIEASLKDLQDLLPYNPIVVRSNHDLWLDRWIVDQDWKKELHNSVHYMEFAHALLTGKAPNGIFPYIVEKAYGDKVKCLKENDSFKIKGWELANHGHMGANGSKGNIEQYRKFNTKVIVGDWHQVSRKDGALSVGTHSKLRMGFNKGPSSWNNGDVIIHPNGKAQHLIFFKNKCTTLL